MHRLLSVFDLQRPTLTLQQEALRLLSVVASGWIMVGALLLVFTNNAVTRTAERVHNMGGTCLLVAAAIYSVVLPLQSLLRKHAALGLKKP